MKKVPVDERWYLEIIPSGSNQKVAEVLGSDVAIRGESQVECADGVCRPLWEVEFSVVNRAIQSLESGEYKIWHSKKGDKPMEVKKTSVDIPDARPRVKNSL